MKMHSIFTKAKAQKATCRIFENKTTEKLSISLIFMFHKKMGMDLIACKIFLVIVQSENSRRL